MALAVLPMCDQAASPILEARQPLQDLAERALEVVAVLAGGMADFERSTQGRWSQGEREMNIQRLFVGINLITEWIENLLLNGGG